MQLVVLAAGHGTRFGGLKQLAPVGPNGEAIMDYTAGAAYTCGFDGCVVVVRDEIRDEMAGHVRQYWPAGLKVAFVCQDPIPGTAQAVASARPALDGPFGVANADDLYGEAALRLVASHLSSPGEDDDAHLLVAYALERTILTKATVKRGLCEQGPDGRLLRVVEHTVALSDGGFDATPIGHGERSADGRRRLTGSETVSMNLWGFRPRFLDHLDAALSEHSRSPDGKELLLVDVVGDLVARGVDKVRVVACQGRCIGVTHREDIAIVRRELAEHPGDLVPTSSTKST